MLAWVICICIIKALLHIWMSFLPQTITSCSSKRIFIPLVNRCYIDMEMVKDNSDCCLVIIHLNTEYKHPHTFMWCSNPTEIKFASHSFNVNKKKSTNPRWWICRIITSDWVPCSICSSSFYFEFKYHYSLFGLKILNHHQLIPLVLLAEPTLLQSFRLGFWSEDIFSPILKVLQQIMSIAFSPD